MTLVDKLEEWFVENWAIYDRRPSYLRLLYALTNRLFLCKRVAGYSCFGQQDKRC